MSIISLSTIWSDNQVLTASALNGNFNDIVNNYNGGITNANIDAAAAIEEAKILFDGAGHNHTGGIEGAVITIPPVNRAFVWYVSGTQIIGANFGPRYVVPESMTITKCWLISRTGPTGSAIIIDINKNGSTIWATQGNRGQIAAGATTGNTTTFDTTALSAGDYLDFDVDQVGSSVAGVDLTVVLECSQP